MALVDFSVWNGYFKGNAAARALDALIDTNASCTNGLILSALLSAQIARNNDIALFSHDRHFVQVSMLDDDQTVYGVGL